MEKKMTEIRNVKNGKVEGGVYIGRGSVWGNRFVIGVDGDRAEVIKKYREEFREKMGDPGWRREVEKLEGKCLMCFCSPLACHGDVIKEWLEEE